MQRNKVGILTLHYGINYGGVLQTYAVLEILRCLGYEPIILDRLPDFFQKSYLFKRSVVHAVTHPDFYHFRRNFLKPISSPAFTSEKLREIVEKEKLEAIVVGSDQVWRKETFSVNGDYFLGFCDNLNIKRIAFAASMGIDTWNRDQEETAYMANQLKKFNAISVRESSAVPLLKNKCGVDSVHIMDPVLIAGREVFQKIIVPFSQSHKPKIVTYILDPQNLPHDILSLFSEMRTDFLHLLPVDPAKRKRRLFRGNCVPKSVLDWIAEIANADFVITDSFHGLVFSILFHRSFAVLPNKERGNSRIQSILNVFGLQSRFCHNAEEIHLARNCKIDYIKVDIELKNRQNQGKEFLKNALTNGITL